MNIVISWKKIMKKKSFLFSKRICIVRIELKLRISNDLRIDHCTKIQLSYTKSRTRTIDF